MATLAERLQACVAKFEPVLTTECPYRITTTADGKSRVTILNGDGDRIGGVGTTVEEAVAALESKLG